MPTLPVRGEHDLNFRMVSVKTMHEARTEIQAKTTRAGTILKKESYDSMSFQAGRLINFVNKWQALHAPPTIIKIIQGLRIPFYRKPPLCISNLKFQTPFSKEMEVTIQSLIQMNVLEPAGPGPGFTSPIFLTPKKDGSTRPIFNLKRLNKYLKVSKFRLINMHRIPSFLQQYDWLIKIDLSNAYFHVPIAEAHRRFLRLIFKDQVLQMSCLPFGIACAPKIFASLTNWVAQIMRGRGYRVVVYLDDFCIVSQNPVLLQKQGREAVQLLQQLGWLVNYEKSILIPQKVIEFLGIGWDPHTNSKFLPAQKCKVTRQKIGKLLVQRKANLKQIQSIVGSLNFASFPVTRGRLNHRALLKHCQSLLYYPKQQFPIPQEALVELCWWQENISNKSLIHFPPVSHYLVTDASELAWGAQVDNMKVWGRWHQNQSALHSNQRELLAVFYALKDHCLFLTNSSLLIQSDNKTVVAFLRNEGGTKSPSLMSVCYKIFQILDLYNIHIEVHYLPGRFNPEADHLSRLSPLPEWHLLPQITRRIFHKWGTPQIDLFASATAHVVPTYASLDVTDPLAHLHDSFSQIWSYKLAWLFPPPYLIPRVLAHLNTATGTFILVAPRWPKVFWRPDLRNRALAAPFTIHNLAEVLIDTVTGRPPPQVRDMTLEVWICGGGLRV